jgi:pimeloyl-ACP methyl ester carboxylesterase/DNA-binding CsgD family transcriptional regulator
MMAQESAGRDVALIVSAMFRLAADPQDWEPLLSALEAAEPLDAAPPAVAAGLSHSQDVARLSASREAESSPTASPWLLLGARGRVLAVGEADFAHHSSCLGDVRVGGRLSLPEPADQLLLEEALEGCRSSAASPQILRFQGPSDRAPSFAYLAPAAVAAGLPGLGPRPDLEGASLLLFAPADAAAAMWRHLRDRFSLTPAEVRLVRKLGEGLSLGEAADDLGVSLATVRNQLKSVFDKVGVHRQSDLVRVLSDLSQVAGVLARGLPTPDPVLEAPPVQYLRLPDGRRLAYREYGRRNGRPFLAFHEGLGSSLLPVGLDGFAGRIGLRVICIDRPGFGQSDPLPEFAFERVAADIETLCDHIGVARLDIFTMISGASAGLSTAIQLGDRVGNLIVISGRPPAAGSRSAARDPVNLMRARIESHPWVMETLFSVLRLRMSKPLVQTFMRRSAQGSPGDLTYLEGHPEVVVYVESYIREALDLTRRGVVDEMRALRRSQNMTLEGLRARLHVWHGEEDQFAPLDQLLRFLGDRVDEVVLFPGVGHFLPLREWPALLRRLTQLPEASPPGPEIQFAGA